MTSEGNEAERIHVPARARVEIRRFEDEMSKLRHLRRLERRALRIVHPNGLVGRVVRDRRPGRQRLALREAVQHVHRHALRIAQADDGPSPRRVGRLDRTAERFRQPFEVRHGGDREPKPHEFGDGPTARAIDVRLRSRPAQEELVFASRGDDQAEVAKISLGLPEVRPLEMNEQQFVGLDDRRPAARQRDAAGSAIERYFL